MRRAAGRIGVWMLPVCMGLLTLACFLVGPVTDGMGIAISAVDLKQRFISPSPAHWLGTDGLGRDQLLRLLDGGRVSILVGVGTALVSSAIAAMVGLAAGWFGGWIDRLLMRLTDSMIALPLLPLLMVLAVVDVQKLGLPPEAADSEWVSVARVVLIVSLVGWTGGARLVRAATLSVRENPYIEAVVAMGGSSGRIMFLHILPNVSAPLIVATTLAVGQGILLESALSFLGLGIQPPTPSWGNMLTGAQDVIWEAPWLAIWPGAAILLTVVSTNLMGDRLQKHLAGRP